MVNLKLEYTYSVCRSFSMDTVTYSVTVLEQKLVKHQDSLLFPEEPTIFAHPFGAHVRFLSLVGPMQRSLGSLFIGYR